MALFESWRNGFQVTHESWAKTYNYKDYKDHYARIDNNKPVWLETKPGFEGHQKFSRHTTFFSSKIGKVKDTMDDWFDDFRADPINMVGTWLYRTAFDMFVPDILSFKGKLGWWAQRLMGSYWKKKWQPYWEPLKWFSAQSRITAFAALSMFSPWFTYDPKGRLGFAPILWMDTLWNNSLSWIQKGLIHSRNYDLSKAYALGAGVINDPNQYLSLDINTRRKLFKDFDVFFKDPKRTDIIPGFNGLSFNTIASSLDLTLSKNVGYNFKKNMIKRLGRYDKNRTIFAILIATIGAGIAAITTAIAARLGILVPLRNFWTNTLNFQGLSDAADFGTGWANLPTPAGGTLTGWQKFQKAVGKIIASGSGLWSVVNVLATAGIKGLLAYGLGSIITGNSLTGAIGGSIYFANSFVRGLMANHRLSGYYIPGVGWIEAGITNPNSFIRTFLLDPIGIGSKASTFIKYFQQYPAIKLLFDRGLPMTFGKRLTIFALRNIPVEGILLSVALIQAGLPVPLALAPIGIDLAVRSIKGLTNSVVGELAFVTWRRMTFTIQTVSGLVQSAYILKELGGIPGVLNELFSGKPLSLKWFFAAQEIPMTFWMMSNVVKAIIFIFRIANVSNPAILLATTLLTAAWYGIDYYLRSTTGLGIWERLFDPVFNWLKKTFFDKFLSKGANYFGAVMFKLLGIFGTIIALATGSYEQALSSFLMIMISGNLTAALATQNIYQQSYYIPGNTQYVESLTKSFTGFSSGNSQLNYSFNLKLKDIKHAEIFISDKLENFDALDYKINSSLNSYYKVYNGSPLLINDNYDIQLQNCSTTNCVEEKLQKNRINFICNNISITIKNITDVNGKIIYGIHQASNRYCIDKNGNFVNI